MNTTKDPMQSYLDRCRGLIAKHGHMVQFVGAAPFGYAYTVGLEPTLGCELLIVGLTPDIARVLLNGIAARLKEGPVADGEPIEKIAMVPLKITTHAVADPAKGRDRAALVAVAGRLGYSPRHIRQVIWPDTQNRFPGDPGYNHAIEQDVDQLSLLDSTNDTPGTRH
mgnify:CR=1 FL=1